MCHTEREINQSVCVFFSSLKSLLCYSSPNQHESLRNFSASCIKSQSPAFDHNTFITPSDILDCTVTEDMFMLMYILFFCALLLYCFKGTGRSFSSRCARRWSPFEEEEKSEKKEARCLNARWWKYPQHDRNRPAGHAGHRWGQTCGKPNTAITKGKINWTRLYSKNVCIVIIIIARHAFVCTWEYSDQTCQTCFIWFDF